MTERPDDLVRAVEATLFAAEAPMTAEAISAHLGGAEVKGPLRELAEHYEGRGIHPRCLEACSLGSGLQCGDR